MYVSLFSLSVAQRDPINIGRDDDDKRTSFVTNENVGNPFNGGVARERAPGEFDTGPRIFRGAPTIMAVWQPSLVSRVTYFVCKNVYLITLLGVIW